MVGNAGFKTAWRACTNDTAVRHLDVDAPLVSRGLYEQARNLYLFLNEPARGRTKAKLKSELPVCRRSQASGR